MLSYQIVPVLLTTAVSTVSAQNPFSGAVGFGSIATGGTGGTTVHVTNLNDSGPGSFRDAVGGSKRIIVFDVSGYIVGKSPISLSSDLTIDGRTAPGAGIGIMGAEVSASKKSNIIIRNMRFRQGNLDSQTGKSAVNIGESSNIIIDQSSIEYGQWDNLDAVKTVNFTVSNSIIALPIGQQFGAHVEGGPSTFYRNLWVSCHNRQPLSKDNTQFINNVVYNFELGYTAGNTGGKFSHDIINNYFIAGPSTSKPADAWFQMNAGQSVYASGNLLDSDKDGKLNGVASNTVGSSTMVNSPWHDTSVGLTTLSAADAYTYVISNAGASPRDEVDTFVVNSVKSLGTSGTLIKDQAKTGLSNGGYGVLL